ncbi:DgyrCDS4523 [Dimorphilus gyrociliatus]|uniref:DgyrCDS4523 n=1 Tax=Dimorphilus gyrociliatus TaxID=2664684 RepID=A0A7I8VJW8_9ANNE|nr:DgyrCDS4523 [Dimorphilus gyrociliatus]
MVLLPQNIVLSFDSLLHESQPRLESYKHQKRPSIRAHLEMNLANSITDVHKIYHSTDQSDVNDVEIIKNEKFINKERSPPKAALSRTKMKSKLSREILPTSCYSNRAFDEVAVVEEDLKSFDADIDLDDTVKDTLDRKSQIPTSTTSEFRLEDIEGVLDTSKAITDAVLEGDSDTEDVPSLPYDTYDTSDYFSNSQQNSEISSNINSNCSNDRKEEKYKKLTGINLEGLNNSECSV